MKKVNELFVPSHDAIDYNSVGEKREAFLKIYNCTSHFERLKERNCYFIIGDKGSGKTALALYHQLNSPNDSASNLVSISSTQYKQFIMLKINHKLEYTDYSSIWRATLLTLMAQFITQKSKKWIHKFTKKFVKIENAINNYDKNALLPQLTTAIQLASTLQTEADLGASWQGITAGVKDKIEDSVKENTETIRFHINEAEKVLKEGLVDLKLSNDFIIFLDGLDAKPYDIDQIEFNNCIQGLYDAMMSLNTDFFPRIKDSKGRMRFCLLIRPDIFESLNGYNSNSRVSDNSVFLNWITTESDFESGTLFKTVNKYFISQNDNDSTAGWNKYFPNKNEKKRSQFFVQLLKNTLMRPRDYFSAVEILIKYCQDNNISSESFPTSILKSDYFNRQLSDYMIGEVKNYMNFYITNKDYADYMKFFDYLNGKNRFTWDEYLNIYDRLKKYLDESDIENKNFYKTPVKLLQFFYESNLIGYYQQPADGSKPFIFWSYREKSINNLNPKVKEEVSYIVFEGVMKALNIGKTFSR